MKHHRTGTTTVDLQFEMCDVLEIVVEELKTFNKDNPDDDELREKYEGVQKQLNQALRSIIEIEMFNLSKKRKK
jgi:hypothetical protein